MGDVNPCYLKISYFFGNYKKLKSIREFNDIFINFLICKYTDKHNQIDQIAESNEVDDNSLFELAIYEQDKFIFIVCILSFS